MASKNLRGTSKSSPLRSMTKDLRRWLGNSTKSRDASKLIESDSDDMFSYTSGRWIYNESSREEERYLRFDVSALQHAIASSVRSPRITSFTKFAEGGFNRIFQATCSDGRQVLTRLPYPSTVPKHYATASEVATLEYLRLNGIPVPRVYAWSSTTSNVVGAEYIIMEKLDGMPLGDIWFTLDFKQRYRVIEQIVQLECKLFTLQLPANGSIYFPRDLNERERAQSVPLQVQGHEFCIGPMAHYSWWHGARSSLDCDRGPWYESNDIFRAVGQRELQWIEKFAKPRLPYERLYRELHGFKKISPQPHNDSLKKHLELAKCLGYSRESPLNRPVLRHPDLQPNNILLSDSLDIIGLIDWQHATVVPLCLAAGIPKDFHNYGDPESERLVQPARDLPSDFELLNPDEQASVKEVHIRRLNHFLYAALTLRHNDEHYDAIFDNGVILHQRLYKQAGTPWEGDSISLDAELINAIQHWQDVLVSGANRCKAPSVQYSEESAETIMELHRQQQEMDATMDQMRKTLGVDVYGWVSNEAYTTTRELAGTIKERMIEAADVQEKEGIRNNFPFDDFDENG